PAGDRQAAVATDGDQAVEGLVGEDLLGPLWPVRVVEGAAPLGAEEGAAARQHPPQRADVEGHRALLQDAVPGVRAADDLVAVDGPALADDGADDGVAPGAVAAAGEDPHAHPRHGRACDRSRAAGACRRHRPATNCAVAWDSSRPVPWKRLFTFVGIY